MPHPVDIHVGAQIRMFRKAKGLTQTEAGEAVGVTFQQMQKYEKGTNRVSASKLSMLAELFGVDIGDFFEGMQGEQPPQDLQMLMLRSETTRLVADFYSIKSRKARQTVLDLIALLSEGSEQEDIG